jgi:Flp pilus assembly protein TadD
LDVKYAAYGKAVPPRPIRVRAGTWAGSAQAMADGSQPQPWHCLPFVEGSVYGLELVYPFGTECHVVNDGGAVRFDFDHAREPGGGLTGGEFITFNPKDRPKFYLFNTRLDVQAPPGHVVRTEPHPRFFTDDTGTVPVALIGHVHSEWYPRKLFVVFKVPPPGTRHVFRKGEAYAQVLFVPQRGGYKVTAMTPAEEAARRDLEQALDEAKSHVADHSWRNPDGAEFNNHYKLLARAYAEGGAAAVRRMVDDGQRRKRGELPLDKPIPEALKAAGELVSRQQFDDARTVYRDVLERDPNNAAALSGLGVCVGCTGAPLSGVELMRQAIALMPNEAAFHENLGQMLVLTQRYAEAVAAYRTAMRLRPNDAALASNVGLLIVRLGNFDEGLKLCRHAAATDPRCAVAHYRTGVILTQLRQHDAARAAYQAALAADPAFEPAMQALTAPAK